MVLSLNTKDYSKYIFLKLTSSGPKSGPNNATIVGNYNYLQNKYLTKGIFNIYLGLALAIAGITVVFISFISKTDNNKLGLSLALILFSFGIMSLIVRTNVFMFFSNSEEILFLMYDLALFLLFPSITYFIMSTSSRYSSKTFVNLFFKIQTIYSIFCILFMIVNKLSFYKLNSIYIIISMPVIGFLFILQLLFLIFSFTPCAIKENGNERILMIGFGIFSLSLIVDLIMYLLININQSFQIWRFGLIAFIVSLLVLFAKTYAEHKDRADSYELELKDISEKARLDYLTKLPNRLAIYEIFEKLSIQLESESLPLSIAIIDIDDFKHINDTYGHIAGDFILVELAKLTREILGPKGELGRWGGEEFLVIFPAMDQSTAHHTADNLRKQIARHKFEYENNTINVTLSLGISTFLDGSTLIECVDFADQALYIAKSNGKNCVVSSNIAI
jgi:diguanylate cyclase (GGDEF)-like protein